MATSGYEPGPGNGGGIAPSGAAAPEFDGRSYTSLRRDYLSYLNGKTNEIKEQQDARRYFHTSQYTADQIKVLNDRKQPVVTYNHEAKKINSVVGLLAGQRRDPKAYPRTDQQAEGAEIATACLRYVTDQQDWEAKDGLCTLEAGIDGIAGVELILEEGDSGKPGDYDIGFEKVAPSAFFYDPRSMDQDFSDARFMGIGKWADLEALVEQFPDKEDEIRASAETGSELTSNPDSDVKWLTMDGPDTKRLRVIDHWYLQRGEWKYCVYTGSVELQSGPSPFFDEKGKSISKFVMFSANVDQDGDRYGFHRNMKSSQDEINQRRSKALHIGNSRRIIVRDGQGLDVEKIRKEVGKADGVIVIPPGAEMPEFDDAARAQELATHLGMLAEAKEELNSSQFNPEAVGNSEAALSGRAIQLRQNAGVAELGPFRIWYRGWKLRLYRALWNAIKRYWTAERSIRVTDDQNAPAIIPINKLGIDPRSGQPVVFNQVNALDVDIILDEGPNEINMQAEAFDTLTALASSGIPVPPEVLIALSSLDDSKKKEVLGIIEKAGQDPAKQAAVQLEMQGKQADNTKKLADAKLSLARANAEGQGDGSNPVLAANLEWRKALLQALTQIEVAKISAGSDADSAALDAKIESLLGLAGLANDQVMQLRDHAHQQAMLRLNPPTPQPVAA